MNKLNQSELGWPKCPPWPPLEVPLTVLTTCIIHDTIYFTLEEDDCHLDVPSALAFQEGFRRTQDYSSYLCSTASEDV